MKAQFKAKQRIFNPFCVCEVVNIRFIDASHVEIIGNVVWNASSEDVPTYTAAYTGVVTRVGRKGNMVLVEAEVPPEIT